MVLLPVEYHQQVSLALAHNWFPFVVTLMIVSLP
jgi:hypothetical protein